jgi:hypothetical protein
MRHTGLSAGRIRPIKRHLCQKAFAQWLAAGDLIQLLIDQRGASLDLRGTKAALTAHLAFIELFLTCFLPDHGSELQLLKLGRQIVGQNLYN